MNFRIGIGFAPGSGDLLIKKANKDNIGKEVILYDRGAMNDSTGDRGWIEESGVSIFQKMGNISLFDTGYTEEYAEKIDKDVLSDERLHFYDRETKKELWNKNIGEESPIIFPDGLSVIIYGYESGSFRVYDRQGKKVFDQKPRCRNQRN